MARQQPLPIATDTGGLNEQVLRDHLNPLLLPWFPDALRRDGTAHATRFDAYLQEGGSVFRMVEPDQAARIVYPLTWQGVLKTDGLEGYKRFYEKHRQKRILLHYLSDTTERAGLGEEWVLRTSIDHRKRRPNEFVLPGWTEDLIQQHTEGFVARAYRARPSVGFVGFARPLDAGPVARLRYQAQLAAFRLGKAKGNVGAALRRAALRRLRAHPGVDLRVEVKSGFVAGARNQNALASDPDKFSEARATFVNGMIDTDYTLCTRGLGNYSFRFFETACCGRIPLFLDTDCPLPFEDQIDYPSMMPMIAYDRLRSLGSTLLRFHRSLGGEDFLDLQGRWRRVWEDYFSPLGYYRQIGRLWGDG